MALSQGAQAARALIAPAAQAIRAQAPGMARGFASSAKGPAPQGVFSALKGGFQPMISPSSGQVFQAGRGFSTTASAQDKRNEASASSLMSELPQRLMKAYKAPPQRQHPKVHPDIPKSLQTPEFMAGVSAIRQSLKPTPDDSGFWISDDHQRGNYPRDPSLQALSDLMPWTCADGKPGLMRTPEALNAAAQDLPGEEMVSKIIHLVESAGQSSDPDATKAAAAQLKGMEVTVKWIVQTMMWATVFPSISDTQPTATGLGNPNVPKPLTDTVALLSAVFGNPLAQNYANYATHNAVSPSGVETTPDEMRLLGQAIGPCVDDQGNVKSLKPMIVQRPGSTLPEQIVPMYAPERGFIVDHVLLDLQGGVVVKGANDIANGLKSGDLQEVRYGMLCVAEAANKIQVMVDLMRYLSPPKDYRFVRLPLRSSNGSREHFPLGMSYIGLQQFGMPDTGLWMDNETGAQNPMMYWLRCMALLEPTKDHERMDFLIEKMKFANALDPAHRESIVEVMQALNALDYEKKVESDPSLAVPFAKMSFEVARQQVMHLKQAMMYIITQGDFTVNSGGSGLTYLSTSTLASMMLVKARIESAEKLELSSEDRAFLEQTKSEFYPLLTQVQKTYDRMKQLEAKVSQGDSVSSEEINLDGGVLGDGEDLDLAAVD